MPYFKFFSIVNVNSILSLNQKKTTLISKHFQRIIKCISLLSVSFVRMQ